MNETIFQDLKRQAHPLITEGVSTNEIQDLITSFDEMLRHEISSPRAEKNDKIARRIGRRVIQKIIEMPPQERLRFIEIEMLDRNLFLTDKASQRMAELCLSHPSLRPVLHPLAEKIYDQAKAACARISEKYDKRVARYEERCMETFLDCDFVFNPKPERVSPRLYILSRGRAGTQSQETLQDNIFQLKGVDFFTSPDDEGYYFPPTKTIYINQSRPEGWLESALPGRLQYFARQELSSQTPEILYQVGLSHSYFDAQGQLTGNRYDALNACLTELYSLEDMQRVNPAGIWPAYKEAVEVVRILTYVDFDGLDVSYLDGDVAHLSQWMDAELGPGAFAALAQCLADGDFVTALEIVTQGMPAQESAEVPIAEPEGLVSQAGDLISRGLSRSEAKRVLPKLERLWGYMLAAEPLQKHNALAQRVGQNLIEKVAHMTYRQKVEFIEQRLVLVELGQLDKALEALAIACFNDPTVRPQVRSQAQSLSQELRAYYDQLRQQSPERERGYRRQLAETFRICDYILDGTKVAGLRLGRWYAGRHELLTKTKIPPNAINNIGETTMEIPQTLRPVDDLFTLETLEEFNDKLGFCVFKSNRITRVERRSPGEAGNKAFIEMPALYRARLPIYLLARCPICQGRVWEAVDIYHLMGVGWWFNGPRGFGWYGRQPKSAGGSGRFTAMNRVPEPSYQADCDHVRAMTYGVNFNGILPDDINHWYAEVGSERPGVLRPFIEQKGSYAVLHSLPLGRYDDEEWQPRYTIYFVTYFHRKAGVYEQSLAPQTLTDPDFYWPFDLVDYNLNPWLAAGKIGWLDTQQPDLPLRMGPAREFPYGQIVGLEGRWNLLMRDLELLPTTLTGWDLLSRGGSQDPELKRIQDEALQRRGLRPLQEVTK